MSSSPNLHLFGLCVEAETFGENLIGHERKTSDRKDLDQDAFTEYFLL